MRNQLKIGVFACECGGEISSTINLNQLLKKTSSLGHVSLTEIIPYGCSPDGEEIIHQKILSNTLDRVVLLGCSPRIMEQKFQKICNDAGINPFLLEMVNLRDQCAWVHQSIPESANEKAWDLVRMGIARSLHLSPKEVLKTSIHPEAAVFGSGVAGMTSALSLADRGITVNIVEKEKNLGGTAYSINGFLPSIETRKKILEKLIERVKASPNINILTQAEPVEVNGSYGLYEITIKVGKRTKKIKCGAIILATGSEELKPEGYYSYGKNKKVITQSELGKIVLENPSLSGLKNLVMIQCAGARNEERPFCGRICCLDAIDNAIFLKQKNPDLCLTVLHRDIPVEPGPDEKKINQARELDIKFIRFAEDQPPGLTSRTVNGRTDRGKPFKLPYDLVLLSTPQVPDESLHTLAHLFHIPVDQTGFFSMTPPDLKPHQFMEPCIYAVGNANQPSTIHEASNEAFRKSSRLASLIEKQEIISSHISAWVDANICRGCGTCTEKCPFDIPLLREGRENNLISFIDPFLCNGCGICTVHCPNGAVSIPNLEDETLTHMVEAALSTRETSGSRIIVFLCEWSGYAVADLAGSKRKPLPREIVPIRIPCAGRISTGLILKAFSSGADGIQVYACRNNQCHYLNGNGNCEAVLADTLNLMNLLGIERERFQMVKVDPTDIYTFTNSLKNFVSVIDRLEIPIVNSIHAEQ